MPTHIDDPEDPRLDPFRSLKDATARDRDGLFVAESARVIERVLSSRFRLRSALLLPTRAAGSVDHDQGEGLAARIEQTCPDAPVFTCRREVLDAVVGFAMHRGAVALVERGEALTPAQVLAAAFHIVVCEDVTDVDNIGGIFRLAAAFGIGGVLLSPNAGDPLYRKAMRVSMGWALHIPYARVEPWPDDLLTMLHDTGITSVALTPRPSAPSFSSLVRALRRDENRLALLLGAEGPGLSDAILHGAHHHARIPISPRVDSLNVATAAGIAMAELSDFR